MMRPYDAKDEATACGLRITHKDVKDFWVLTDGYRVSIAQQLTGEPPTQHVMIPRAVFNEMVDWYMREQKAAKAA
jgi:hypothetical protein